MNILPKKRWHVRTKENIARVRKDEAEAAEKERQEKLRIENADREARLNVLKQKSRQHLMLSGVLNNTVKETLEQETSSQAEHINLFADLEHAIHTTNKEHDKEIKEKSEDYEKKIGYLTYLGQDTNEALKKKNWYEVLPEERNSESTYVKDTYDKLVLKDKDGKPKSKELDEKYGEIGWKAKQRLDPINRFKKNCKEINIKSKNQTLTSKHSPTETKHKHKKHKKVDKEDREMKLQKLREARLRREQQEKHKTELFLSGFSGNTSMMENKEPSVSKVKAKYNSQFNPELARQNYNR